MEWIDVATLTVRREFRPGTYEKMSGDLEPCFDLHRDCGLGCTCAASVWFRDGQPTVDAAESKCLCFNDRKRQGISEIKGTGRAIKEGPDEWIYEVQAKLTEARHNAQYKCVEDGRTTYAEMPCSPRATAVAIRVPEVTAEQANQARQAYLRQRSVVIEAMRDNLRAGRDPGLSTDIIRREQAITEIQIKQMEAEARRRR